MFTQLTVPHVLGFSTNPSKGMNVNAARQVVLTNGPESYNSAISKVASVTYAVDEWYGNAVSVIDPEGRGPMVLTWSANITGIKNDRSTSCVIGYVDLAPGGAPVPSGVIDPFSPSNFVVAPIQAVGGSTYCSQGGMLVDTTPASPAQTRYFFISWISETQAAGTTNIKHSLQAALFEEIPQFFQPGKS